MSSKAPTTDQLRNNIDKGETGEKVRFPDPAAAPLGTDAEASGNSPTLAEREMEAQAQPRHRERRPMNGLLLYAGFFAIACAVVLGAAYFGMGW